MTGAGRHSAGSFAMVALACFIAAQSALAQESWGSAQGGASSWQTGSTARTATTPRASAPGGGASWTAGAGNFKSGNQPGGVWREESAYSGAAGKSAAETSAAGARPLKKSLSVAGANPATGTGRGLATPGKGQPPQSANGFRSSAAVRTGAANRGRSSVLKSTNARPVGARSGVQAPKRRAVITGWKTGPGSTQGSAAESDSLSAPSLTDLLNSAEPANSEDAMH